MDFEKIKSLNNEIKELIAKRPELQDLQDEINNRTNGVNSHNRQQILLSMMVERRAMMVEKFFELAALSKKSRGLVKEIK